MNGVFEQWKYLLDATFTHISRFTAYSFPCMRKNRV